MATKQKLELNDYVPNDWSVIPTTEGVRLVADCKANARFFYEGAKCYLQESANRLGKIEITCLGSDESIQINPEKSKRAPISSYAPVSVSPNSSYEEITDFIVARKQEGLIVTVTSMISDKCLIVNDLQVIDRGGSWTGEDWIGLDFKKLWIDSFHIGRVNYYGQLVEAVKRDHYLPNFYYHIRRPSGALAEYSSSYHFVDSFLGTPARIAVSNVGDWRVIEDAPDGSEMKI